MKTRTQKKAGFSLIELLLSVAIIAMIGAMGAPLYQAFQNRNDLYIAALLSTQNLRRAQVLSQASEGDSDWGVHLETGLITLFKGSDYDSRDTDYDERSNIGQSVSITGDTEIIFSKHFGTLNSNKNIVLNSLNNETKTLQINQKGMIEY